MAPTSTPRSRRRGPEEIEEAIRAAVVQLLAESGIAAVTMEAVATRAGASKPVLYRRWSNRTALLRDVLVPMAMDAIPHADTGSYRGDMVAVLRGWAAFFRTPNGRISPALVGALPHDRDLEQAFRHGMMAWRKEAMADLIRRGI